MKTLGLSIFLILVISFNGKAQVNDTLKSANIPHENISVNKKYDDKGNLIQYDSVYTYSYSNHTFDSVDWNSIMGTFPGFFNQNLGHFMPHDFIQNDSLFFKDFFTDDFFEHGFINQNEDFMQLMQRMDSIKNEFFEMNHF